MSMWGKTRLILKRIKGTKAQEHLGLLTIFNLYIKISIYAARDPTTYQVNKYIIFLTVCKL